MLDIYKWFTPHVDLVAPDIYIADAAEYAFQCSSYARPDNPLFVPESAPAGSNAWNLFRALAEYNAIGYSFFAAEHIFTEDGAIRPETQAVVDSFRCAAAAIPLLLRYQGTGRIQAVVQEENLGAQPLQFEGCLGLAEFGGGGYKDWRHTPGPGPAAHPDTGRGRGLVVQAGRHEFYLVGAAFRLTLRPQLPPEKTLDATLGHLLTRQAHLVRVDEGHFGPDGQYVVDRRRNGDEIDFGVWVEPDCGVVRVIVCE
jgi:hypothetical protein